MHIHEISIDGIMQKKDGKKREEGIREAKKIWEWEKEWRESSEENKPTSHLGIAGEQWYKITGKGSINPGDLDIFLAAQVAYNKQTINSGSCKPERGEELAQDNLRYLKALHGSPVDKAAFCFEEALHVRENCIANTKATKDPIVAEKWLQESQRSPANLLRMAAACMEMPTARDFPASPQQQEGN